MPTRTDPQRLTLLRRQFERDLKKRFRNLAREIRKLVIGLDVFGLGESPLLFNVERRAWSFQTNPQKLASFRRWLQEQIDVGILEVAGDGKPWNAKYIESAYNKGVTRAFVDVRSAKLQEKLGFLDATKEEFLRSSFSQPGRLTKVEFLFTRTFEELRGVSNEMARRLNRTLAIGLAEGRGARQIAREMAANISGLSRQRAQVIARTELAAAHSEGQLDAFEDLGIEEVGVFAEWSTAGDDRVCPICAPNEAQLFTIKDARGLIPAHPNCRCAWIPATEANKRFKRQQSLKRRRATRRRQQA